MIIEIIDSEHYSGNVKPGKYQLQPYDTPTERQNKTFHCLLAEYWKSGCHSYHALNLAHFREVIKMQLGAGVEKYFSLVDENGNVHEKPVIRYRVKSWSNYSKKERTETIDRLIAEMLETGVRTKHFEEILQGLESNSITTNNI